MGQSNDTSSIIHAIQGNNAMQMESNQTSQQLLEQIAKNIEQIAKNGSSMGQGAARSQLNDETARQRRASQSHVGRREKEKPKKEHARGWEGFLDGMEDEIIGPFKDKFKESMSSFSDNLAKELGVSKSELSHEMGKQLMSGIKKTKVGSDISGAFDGIGKEVTKLSDAGMNSLSSAFVELKKGKGLQEGVQAFTQTFSASGASIGGAAKAILPHLAKLGPYAAAAAAAIAAAALVMHQLNKAGQALKEGFSALGEGISQAANRDIAAQQAAVEAGNKRLEADIETLVTAPFENLKKATDDLCNAWEQSIATINATQGYTKEGLQDLISNYAERLRKEGLSSVVSSADITTNLQKVIEAGLSGAAAEEFAYIATVLQDAIPTQDFFSYASTYASIAANAMKDGLSQTDALSAANAEMEQFASNVLYASRQLSGGFSTGLQNTSELFANSYKIAQSAKIGSASNISGVLTSVAGIIGAIAPDLSESLVDSVVDAAIGGNSETNVALRSLAGVNASNTQFLTQLAQNPQKIFSNLFTNLANMQSSSKDNFMEVAEGLSGVFGVTMDSLARVDFNYLADAISQMNVNNASLADNIQLLKAGETKTTTEQLKIAEINKLMIEEGLSYVLDSEASRAIQDHLWEEQLALELKESTFAVELQGSANTFLEKISEAVKAINTILNPWGALAKKVSNLALTQAEAKANDSDVKQLLQLGKVGDNLKVFQQLTTRGKKQNLTDSILKQMGGASLGDAIRGVIDISNSAYNMSANSTVATLFGPAGMVVNSLSASADITGKALSGIGSIINRAMNVAQKSSVKSSYEWGMVSKSLNTVIKQNAKNADYYTQAVNTSVASQIDTKSQVNFENFLATIEQFVKENKSYEDWKATAGRFGIKDIAETAKQFGVTQEALEGKFQEHQATQAAQQEYQRKLTEDEFWKQNIKYVTNTAPTFHSELLSLISKFYRRYESFYNDWIDYYIKHTAYTAGTLDAYKVEQILTADKTATSDAVNALADALLSNAVDLKDPQIQTNVLLSQMLVTLNAILQQNTKTNNSVLPTSLSALGLGLVSNV